MCSHRFLELFRRRQGGQSCGRSQVSGHICDHLGPLACLQTSSRGLLLSFTLFTQHLTSPCILCHTLSYFVLHSPYLVMWGLRRVHSSTYTGAAPPPRGSRLGLVLESMLETARDWQTIQHFTLFSMPYLDICQVVWHWSLTSNVSLLPMSGVYQWPTRYISLVSLEQDMASTP